MVNKVFSKVSSLRMIPLKEKYTWSVQDAMEKYSIPVLKINLCNFLSLLLII